MKGPLWVFFFFSQSWAISALFTLGEQNQDEQYTRGQPCWTAGWREQLHRRSFLPFANQRSKPPSHGTATASACVPDDGLLRTPRTPYGLIWSLKRNHEYTFTQLYFSNLEVGCFMLAGRHDRCISHRRTWVKSEPDKSRVLSDLCPACSCHLPGYWERMGGAEGNSWPIPKTTKGQGSI